MRGLVTYFTIVLGCVFVSSLPAAAVMNDHAADIYEVPLDSEQFIPQYEPAIQAAFGHASPAWQSFASSLAADWRTYEWNTALDIPRFAAGEPVPLMDAASLGDRDLATGRVSDFLRQAEGVLRIPASDFRLDSYRTYRAGQRAWVHYQQTYQGLPVFYAYLGVHLYEGSVNAMRADVFPDIAIDPQPYLSEMQAAERARAGLPWNEETDSIGAITLGVLPKVWDDEVLYVLAYEVMVNTADPVGQWRTFVDAFTGEIHWRFNEVQHYTVSGTTVGDVQERLAYDPYTSMGLPDQVVEADGTVTYTDENGDFEIDVAQNQQYTVTAQNRGRYIRVYRNNILAEITDLASPGDPAQLEWNDANTSPAERDCYYHANVVHSWIKSLDPGFTSLDYPMPCHVDLTGGSCNAYYNGMINFYAAGGGCVNFGQIADIVYHEYHHGVTQFTYYGSPPTPSGLNEGFSDYCSMAINNDPCTAKGYTLANPDGCMRTGLNNRQYPGTECGGEVHCLGEICMGALWKVRSNLLDKYGQDYQHQADLLFREANIARPYYNTSLAQDYLIANDDNGNYNDGTPDYWEIYDGFQAHSIPVPAITIKIAFDHEPLGDQLNAIDPILVTADITTEGDAGEIIPDSCRVYFSLDGETYQGAPLSNVGGDTYEGYIQAQPGKVVDYYLYSVTTYDIAGTDPIRAPEVYTHQFLAGEPTTLLDDDLEEDLGWTLGAPDDNATNGLWERVDPEGKEYSGETIQPEDDHTPDGTLAFVTDGAGGYWSNYNVDNGKTSVLSPQYEFAPGSGGFVEFYVFFAQYGTTQDDTLSMHLSGDGESWVKVWALTGDDWNDPNYTHHKVYFRSEDLGESPELLQVRFEAEDNENNGVTEAALDDILVRIGVDWADVQDEPADRLSFQAAPASPSVFARSTAIRFAIPASEHVALKIYDVSGRNVRTLVDKSLEAGNYQMSWDGRDERGEQAPAGLYYYKLSAGPNEATRKLVYVR